MKPYAMKLRKAFLLLPLFAGVQALAQEGAIEEQRYLTLGGIEQWVTIKGDNTDNPAILFLHGGPGSVMSPYSDNIYGAWEEEYVLINWDQRGAGRTFGRNAPEEVDENYWMEHRLTLDRMVQDGIELAEYLTTYLNKKKLILIGTSWGSLLGAKMALARPDLFAAYLGHAQFVDFTKNFTYAYEKVLELAREAGDSTALQELGILGKPMYTDARSVGQLLRIVKRYEQQDVTPAPADWWKVAPEYANETDTKDRYQGDDYSFLYFAGHEKMGIRPMALEVHLDREGLDFKIPVYFIQGEKDILTASELNKPYFDAIAAPDKGYYLLPDAGHGHNKAVVDTQYQILREKVK